jgi:serine/threonine protein kinase
MTRGGPSYTADMVPGLGDGGVFAPGHVLDGRFRIEALIGRGGFGMVYRATQIDLERAVAVKVMLPHAFMQPGALDRFRREAEVTRGLGHPNTVRLYAYGVGPHGAPYTVWELLGGQPLDALLRQTPRLPLATVVRIGEQVLKSLIEAHGAGIVHRDIKPANLFLCQFAGERDFVKVLDFGIASGAADGPGDSSEGPTALTQTGQSIGTPSYMSPEQADGARGIDGRSDLYSLALVLAEAMCGHVVMQGSSGMRICIEHVSDRPVPFPPEVLGSPIGPVLARAGQKNRDLRYASAQEMLGDLQRHFAGRESFRPHVSPFATSSLGALAGPARGARGSGAPSAAQPAPPALPQRSSTSARLGVWALMGVGALLLMGSGVWGARVLIADEQREPGRDREREDRRHGGAKTSTASAEPADDTPRLELPRVATRTKAADSLRDFEVHGKSAQEVLDALTKRSIEVVDPPIAVGFSKDIAGINYVIAHTVDGRVGSVCFHTYGSVALAENAVRMIGDKHASKRDERSIVFFLIDGDIERSQTMLDELIPE